jgi:cytochrome c nitrite reductase small subunit
MSKSLSAVLCALLGVFAGLGAFTFEYAKGSAYFSNDPNACANCHIMRDYLDSWQKSSHHGRAVCNDCHTPHEIVPKLITKADNGWNHSLKFTLGTSGDPIRIRAANESRLQSNCLRCHQEFVSDIRTVAAHETSGDVNCMRCHAGVGHGPRR